MRIKQTIVHTILHRKLQIRISLKNEIISPVVKCRSQMAITVHNCAGRGMKQTYFYQFKLNGMYAFNIIQILKNLMKGHQRTPIVCLSHLFIFCNNLLLIMNSYIIRA
jgi:hypothetical protein